MRQIRFWRERSHRHLAEGRIIDGLLGKHKAELLEYVQSRLEPLLCGISDAELVADTDQHAGHPGQKVVPFLFGFKAEIEPLFD